MTCGASRQERERAFTVLELLVSLGIVATLAVLSLAEITQMRSMSQGAFCANSLRQLSAATALYLGDHGNTCFQFKQPVPGGYVWYFGFESTSSLGQAEGQRTVDGTRSPLYPYICQVGGIEVCPAFPYNMPSILKQKYTGASWGYGFNSSHLSGVNISTVAHPAQVLLFGDCAQVNIFEPPASRKIRCSRSST